MALSNCNLQGVEILPDIIFHVWVKAISLAIGMDLNLNGSIIENSCWLHPEYMHKQSRIRCCLKRCQHCTLESMSTAPIYRLYMNGSTKLSIYRNIQKLQEKCTFEEKKLLDEYDFSLVISNQNQADKMMRVPQK